MCLRRKHINARLFDRTKAVPSQLQMCIAELKGVCSSTCTSRQPIYHSLRTNHGMNIAPCLYRLPNSLLNLLFFLMPPSPIPY
ncbi:hypothetical protein Gogos_004315 [Gossypium gossypioides]|uniref:Uncharacterized protein n=1 Tax=Gossypium gossypioides TaxID=34282 RepID=A0A7J9CG27_GOSGO|nr:hypothetical protein [Gossypium gossypioides]